MVKPWKVGDICLLRGLVNDRIWAAQSVIVVRDQPDEVVLCLLPGAECAYPEGYWRWKVDRNRSQGTRWQEARDDTLRLRKFSWERNRLLIYLEPEKYYGVFMFWEGMTDRFLCYYVNFQTPIQRSSQGFETLDLDLDIVISPEYNWEWKDKVEYQEGITEGCILPEWAAGVEGSKGEVLDRIERRTYPLDGSWLDWRPDPAWLPPQLPPNWDIID